MNGEAWDCDIFFQPEELEQYADIDLEDAESDWQIIALDRFADRVIWANRFG